MNEETTIKLAKAGNEAAFRELYGTYREAIYRLAYRYTRSQSDAEDIMQDTFIKAFKSIGSFRAGDSSSFGAWLNRICINHSISFLRKNKRRKMDQTIPLSEILAEPDAPGPSPDDAAHTGQVLVLVNKAVQKLSARQRVVFDLRFSQHRQISEIAEYLGCSESNVKTQIFRSIAKLRKQLEPILEER